MAGEVILAFSGVVSGVSWGLWSVIGVNLEILARCWSSLQVEPTDLLEALDSDLSCGLLTSTCIGRTVTSVS